MTVWFVCVCVCVCVRVCVPLCASVYVCLHARACERWHGMLSHYLNNEAVVTDLELVSLISMPPRPNCPSKRFFPPRLSFIPDLRHTLKRDARAFHDVESFSYSHYHLQLGPIPNALVPIGENGRAASKPCYNG